MAELREFGFDEGDGRLLDARGATDLCNADRVVGGYFTPHCAAIHPLRLAHAIAGAAQRAGVRIAEGVTVFDVEPRRVVTGAGTIRAEVVVLATEAYTATLPAHRRDVLPLYSMMVGSEPLSADQLEQSRTPEPADVHERDEHGDLRSAHG